jgi:hypothetical protein
MNVSFNPSLAAAKPTPLNNASPSSRGNPPARRILISSKDFPSLKPLLELGQPSTPSVILAYNWVRGTNYDQNLQGDF